MLSLIEKRLTRNKALSFLEKLAASDTGSRTLYLPPGRPHDEITGLLSELPGETPQEITNIITGAETGTALFYSPDGGTLIVLPFPIEEISLTPGYYVKPLQELLSQELRIALVLVRLGAYAVGICRGENLTLGKAGTGLVHGRHKKGGSSQARFRRHREKQIEAFLTRVCAHAREQLETESLDYLVYGGSREAILSLQKRCPFLERLKVPTLPPLTSLPDPRRAVLEKAVELVWSCRVIEWQEEQT